MKHILVLRQPRAQGLQVRVSNALPIAKDDGRRWLDDCRSIGKVDEIRVIDLDAIDVAADLPDQGDVIDIDLAVAGTVEQFQAVEQRGAGPPPVSRAFVAAAIARVGAYEAVDAAHALGYSRNAPRGIALEGQIAGQPVRVDPRVPVVDPARRESHPPKVVSFQARGQDALLNLALQARTDQGRDRCEPFSEQIVGPGQERRGLGSKEVDDWLGGIGQAAACALNTYVGGYAPARLFTDQPDAVRDLVEEAPLVLEAFCQDQAAEHASATKVQLLESGAVADARVFEIAVREQQ
ncbi:MAG: hypothetical protein ACK2UX_11510 [Anaerolineae bacterium]